jgi:hypothetical protein
MMAGAAKPLRRKEACRLFYEGGTMVFNNTTPPDEKQLLYLGQEQ